MTRRVVTAIAAAAALYPSANLHYIQNRMYYVNDPIFYDYLFGGILVVLIIDATRRATAWAVPIARLCFLMYGLTWADQSVGIMLDQLYLTTEGIFGIPLNVSATYVITTGTFIIPLMKRTGYRREFAGAVEAVVSTGGQLMPRSWVLPHLGWRSFWACRT